MKCKIFVGTAEANVLKVAEEDRKGRSIVCPECANAAPDGKLRIPVNSIIPLLMFFFLQAGKPARQARPIRTRLARQDSRSMTDLTGRDASQPTKTSKYDDLKKKYDALKEKHEQIEKQLAISKEQLAISNEQRAISDEQRAISDEQLAIGNEQNEALQQKIFQLNAKRHILHNLVLGLRGNILVIARIRPPLSIENGKALCSIKLDEDSLEIVSNEMATSTQKPLEKDFAFDHVFDQNATQEEIFEMVSPLIQSAVDGYNVCIFSYGEHYLNFLSSQFNFNSLSGQNGISGRTVKFLFDLVTSARDHGSNYTITASFFEVYNEVLYDLLSKEKKKIEITAVSKSETEVTSAVELEKLMRVAREKRATASTAANERSSRSHAVTRLKIVGSQANCRNPLVLVSYINLVDLAAKESFETSTRPDETNKINVSLMQLKSVVEALVQKEAFIPYRNSKLTHLLEASLGGNSKTLMFVNISPLQEQYNQSLKSLRFASLVKSVKQQKAKPREQRVRHNSQ